MTRPFGKFLVIGFVAVLLLFVLRCFEWQILDSDRYLALASNRFLSTAYLPAGRGRILDRNGVVIAANKLTYSLAVVLGASRFEGFDAKWYRGRISRLYSDRLDPMLSDDARTAIDERIAADRAKVNLLLSRSETVAGISKACEGRVGVTELASSITTALLRVSRGWESSWTPIVVARTIPDDLASEISAYPSDYPGWTIIPSLRRTYPWGEDLYQVTGYLRAVSQSDMEVLEEYGFISGLMSLSDVDSTYLRTTSRLLDETVGATGLERSFESQIRGSSGLLRKIRLRTGEEKCLDDVKPRNGSDIISSIDVRFQKIAREEIGDQTGSIVVMEPETGEILAYVSNPSISPSEFSDGISSSRFREISADPDRPLLNRPTQGLYPPGSVFKIVMAAAGLELGVVDDETRFTCTSDFSYGGRRIRCYGDAAHGSVSLAEALKVSCNKYFFHLANQKNLSMESIGKFAGLFGFGERTGVELPFEKPGNISGLYRMDWDSISKYQYAIGQGTLLVTPLQVARMMAAFANGGFLVKPTMLRVQYYPTREKLQISDGTFDRINAALARVSNEPGGTGYTARPNCHEKIAGKTGSAEYGAKDAPTHSWFASFGPVGKPGLVIVVMCEKAGTGGKVAAPIAAAIYERIFALTDNK
ncbi:MAG: penicillin-binding transpeptidase domain-containing protein [Candidatus Brocadiia bacterium]